MVAVPADLWYIVLQGGEDMEGKLLKDLYDCFCTPPAFLEEQTVDGCRQVLIKTLEKSEGWLALCIIDAKGYMLP